MLAIRSCMLVTICIFFISLTIDAYIFYYTTALESFAASDMRAKLHVLMQGNRIHAQIFPPDNVQFKPLIEEGKVYNLSYF